MQSHNRESAENIIRYAITAAAAVLFTCTAYLAATGKSSPIDDAIMSEVYAMRTDGAAVFWTAVTHCGDAYTVTTVIALLLLIPQTRKVYGIAAAPAGTAEKLFCLKNTIRYRNNKIQENLILRLPGANFLSI